MAMETVFTKHDDSLGKDFKVTFHPDAMISKLKMYIDLGTVDEDGDCDEYPLGKDEYGGETTQADRDADIKVMNELIDLLENCDGTFMPDQLVAKLVDIIETQPKKKNGSFSKGRVNDVHTFHSFGHYWEDSYGTNTPAIRVRSNSDYECTLGVEEYVIKY